MSTVRKTLRSQLFALFLGLVKVGVTLLGLAALAVLALHVLLGGVLGAAPPGDQGLDARLIDGVSPSDVVLDLTEMTNFDWTRFCVTGGYYSKSTTESLLEVDWDYSWTPGWDESEAMAIFLDGDVVVATSGLNAFVPLSGKCFTSDNASFSVHFRDGYWVFSERGQQVWR